MSSTGGRSASRLTGTWRGIGIALYLATGWLYLGSALVVPYPWVYGFWSAWIVGAFVLARVARRSPAWTPIVPICAVALWVTVVQTGSWLLGWTA